MGSGKSPCCQAADWLRSRWSGALRKLTGVEYLRFMADIYKVSTVEWEERLPELLSQFGMEEAVGDLIQSYSRGMKQKITLIAALLHQPRVWILDVPWLVSTYNLLID